MTTAPESPDMPVVRYEDLPMAHDRGAGWAALRGRGRVVAGDGWYYLTQRSDVVAALRDPKVFSSTRAFDGLASPVPLIPLALDPPEHTRFRRILHPFFGPQALASTLPALQAQATELIGSIAGREDCEVMADLATPYPSQVFLTLFGLPLADRDRLIAWKDAIIGFSLLAEPSNDDLMAAAQFYEYLTAAVDSHRAHPGTDVLSQLLIGDGALTDPEALGLSFVLVLAGLDTVTAALGAAILHLAQRPDLRDRLRAEPAMIPGFVEEMLRLEPPVPVLGRVTTEAVTVADVTIPAGAQVRLCIGAISRDGSDPTSGDDTVVDGKLHRHWGFGGGVHRCLGSHLARMELNVVIAEWLRLIPDFGLAPGYRPEITWPAATCALPTLPLRLG